MNELFSRPLKTRVTGLLLPLLILGSAFDAVPAAAQIEVEAASRAASVDAAAGARLVTAPPVALSPLSVSPAMAASVFSPSPSLTAAPAFTAGAARPVSAAAADAAAPAVPAAAAPPASDTAAAAAPASAPSSIRRGSKRRAAALARLKDIAEASSQEVARKFEAAGVAAPLMEKLGKGTPIQDPRTLPLKKYVTTSLPAAPAQVDFSKPVKQWGMMLNDKIGDCTVASCGHLELQWTANAGKPVTIPDSAILNAYEAFGYRPGDASTDNGAQLMKVLKYWRKTGIDGHKIGAFASIDPANFDLLRSAINIFGGGSLGIAMPVSAQKQDVWDVPAGGTTGDGAPGSWGGHAVSIAGYTPQGLVIVTWGGLKLMTWNFVKTYVDEAYAIISSDFLKDGKTPNNGLDIAALKSDLKEVTTETKAAGAKGPKKPKRKNPKNKN
jgi:hypothetical protein